MNPRPRRYMMSVADVLHVVEHIDGQPAHLVALKGSWCAHVTSGALTPTGRMSSKQRTFCGQASKRMRVTRVGRRPLPTRLCRWCVDRAGSAPQPPPREQLVLVVPKALLTPRSRRRLPSSEAAPKVRITTLEQIERERAASRLERAVPG